MLQMGSLQKQRGQILGRWVFVADVTNGVITKTKLIPYFRSLWVAVVGRRARLYANAYKIKKGKILS